jgi:prolipoprotein diacylglyceryltransferase
LTAAVELVGAVVVSCFLSQMVRQQQTNETADAANFFVLVYSICRFDVIFRNETILFQVFGERTIHEPPRLLLLQINL